MGFGEEIKLRTLSGALWSEQTEQGLALVACYQREILIYEI